MTDARPPGPAERRYAYDAATIDMGLLREIDGLELMERVRDGRLPSSAMAGTMGFRFAEVGRGRVVVEAEPGEHLLNLFGAAQGGFAATLLDTAMACAGITTLPLGRGLTTVDLTVSYVRPVRVGVGPVRAEGRAVHTGRRTATADGRLLAADGRLLAHGVTTLLVLDLAAAAADVRG